MFQPTPYALPLAIVVALGATAALLTWRRADSAAERWFVGVQVVLAAWALDQVVVVSLVPVAAKVHAVAVGIGIALYLPVTMLGFTLQYTGRGDWLTRRRIAALLAAPVAFVLVATVVGVQGFVIVNAHVTRGPMVRLHYDWGPGTLAAAVVSYAVIAGYARLLFQKFRRSRNVYRNIAFSLFAAVIVLSGAAAVSFAGLSPLPHLLLLPYAYLFFGCLAVLGLVSKRFVRALSIDRALARLSSRFESVSALARDFVLEEIDNGVVVLDDERRIVDINTTAKRMLGVQRAIGRPVSVLVDRETIVHGESVVDVVEGADGTDGEVTDHVWVETDRGERCYEVAVSTLTNHDTVVGRVLLLHDVTEQQRREDRLEERKTELERQKERLQQRTTQLEHQNRRLDRFASIVSHDLRNPLNVAEGYAELMAAERDGDTVTVDAAHVEELTTAHQRMEAIIDDALAIARQGKAITETEPIELAAAAADAWGHVETAETTMTVDTDLVVEADRDRLLNLFENLYRNAVEHGGGDVTVTVGTCDTDAPCGFFVADDGVGIPDDQKEAVLDHGFTTSEAGTGIGLAIVTDVAGAHGWTVHVTDSDDGGARFEFGDVAAATPHSAGTD
ncbi:MAG: histidine kinase N-terminal 7TM domain-containing protein [Haloarculaceae archaeon]